MIHISDKVRNIYKKKNPHHSFQQIPTKFEFFPIYSDKKKLLYFNP